MLSQIVNVLPPFAKFIDVGPVGARQHKMA